MNKETYEALKNILDFLREYLEEQHELSENYFADLNKDRVKVKGWIDEVAKEYNE